MNSHASKTSFLKTKKLVCLWKMSFTCMGALFCSLKQKPVLAWEREACLKEKHCRNIVKSNPTTIPNDPGNAQVWKETPKQNSTTILAVGVVFGLAGGKASTTFQDDKKIRKLQKTYTNIIKQYTQNLQS